MLAGEPISGRKQSKTSTATWDFARLLSRNRSLFQLEGEKALTDPLSTDSNKTWTFDHLLQSHAEQADPSQVNPPTLQSLSQPNTISQPPIPPTQTTLLKFFPTLLLLSAYLASHTQPKHDILLFSRLSSSSTHKRRYLSSTLTRVRKTPTKPKSTKPLSTSNSQDPSSETTDINPNNTTPSKSSRKITASNLGPLPTPEKTQTHRSSRLLFEKTSSIPRPFSLERLVAIVRAVHPDGIPRAKGTADRVYVELSELERLRLVLRLGMGAGGGGGDGSGSGMMGGGGGGRGGNGDDGILEEKWRVNVSREVVVDMGRRWGFGVEGWEIE